MTIAPSLKILCVDDNRDAATSLADVIGVHGYDTECSFDGEEGWEAARRFRPDACVLDIHMPRMDGCELARRLRQEFGPDVLLIAVTAVVGGEYDERIDDAGFDWLFTKPADPNLVIETVERFATAR